MRKGQKKPCPKRCLNGATPMTRAEANARRRELDKNPFHHALSRKVANAWWAKHRDELNARRRAWYAENRESERARQRKWNAEHPESRKRSWKKWADKNRAYLRMRDRARAADPEKAERRRLLRRKRLQDPRVLNRVRWQRRLHYHTHKHDAIGLRWRLKFQLIPKWKKIVAEGADRIERYCRRCSCENWSLFVKWACGCGVSVDPQMYREVRAKRKAGR